VKIVGVTGGIATGKSTFNQRLISRTGVEFFDSDACSRILLDTDPVVHGEMVTVFGEAVFGSSGKPDRAALRERVFSDAAQRQALEKIIHPRVKLAWREMIATAQCTKETKMLVVDVPLLYEIESARDFDLVIVVACSRSSQMTRMVKDRKLSQELAGRILKTQMPLKRKFQRCDIGIWNGGSFAALHAQADLVGEYLVN